MQRGSLGWYGSKNGIKEMFHGHLIYILNEYGLSKLIRSVAHIHTYGTVKLTNLARNLCNDSPRRKKPKKTRAEEDSVSRVEHREPLPNKTEGKRMYVENRAIRVLAKWLTDCTALSYNGTNSRD